MKTGLHAAFQALAAEKQAVLKREEKLLADLREVLARLGYRLEPLGANSSRGVPRRSSRRRQSASRGAKPLTCNECGRTFALPLHLGRHMSVTHKGGRVATHQPGSSPGESGAARAQTKPRRSRMSPAARRAAARRMKAYWKKRKTAERTKSTTAARRGSTRAKAGRPSRSKESGRTQQRAA
jgi:hypothetical protein